MSKVVIGAPLGRWQTNCYLVGDREQGACVVVDPGEGAGEAVPDLLAEAGLTCEAILLTHGHLDHFWGMPELARSLDVPVLMHADDRWLWDDPGAGFGIGLDPGQRRDLLRAEFGLDWDPPTERLEEVRDHQTLKFAGTRFTVRHNPGHTPGHVTYLAQDLAGAEVAFPLGSQGASDHLLFSGDLIFAGSIGRSDFPRGSTEQIFASLVDTVLPLEDDTVILTGHGPDTTVGTERATNPFLAQALSRHP